jgi:hypothetical protein
MHLNMNRLDSRGLVIPILLFTMLRTATGPIQFVTQDLVICCMLCPDHMLQLFYARLNPEKCKHTADFRVFGRLKKYFSIKEIKSEWKKLCHKEFHILSSSSASEVITSRSMRCVM